MFLYAEICGVTDSIAAWEDGNTKVKILNLEVKMEGTHRFGCAGGEGGIAGISIFCSNLGASHQHFIMHAVRSPNCPPDPFRAGGTAGIWGSGDAYIHFLTSGEFTSPPKSSHGIENRRRGSRERYIWTCPGLVWEMLSVAWKSRYDDLCDSLDCRPLIDHEFVRMVVPV